VLTLDRLYVNGEWSPPLEPSDWPVIDATTEDLHATLVLGGASDAARAAAAASQAFGDWSALRAKERAEYLGAVAEFLDRRRDEIAATISHEVGTPFEASRSIQAAQAIADLTIAAEQVDVVDERSMIRNSMIVREPVGVVAAITPWNYPLHQICAKVGPALVAGNTVVVKPSELAPTSAYLLAEAFAEAGVPRGVFNLVAGLGPTVGEALAADPCVDMVSFTGSIAAGKRVMGLAASSVKKVSLELGGKSAMIVAEDADLRGAVARAVASCLGNNGQTCSALTRLIVPYERLAEVEALVVNEVKSRAVGDPFDPATQVGPLISDEQRRRVQGHVRLAINLGARLVIGGVEPPASQSRGFFVRPTVFSGVAPDAPIAQEEVFGPVLTILTYSGIDDAVRIANGTRYGLSGAVWAGTDEHAIAIARRLRTGQVSINGGPYNQAAPFGGFRESGFGRELGRFGVEEFLQPKALHLRPASRQDG
jgi:aldehyde dehydrogenase (NAD+)